MAWGCIGFLHASGNQAYLQTSSVGLSFIAFPTAASLDDNGKILYSLYCFTLFICGIDTSFSYIEAFVTNIHDSMQWTRWKIALGVCLLGILLSTPFTTNFGWILFDMTEHYIISYIVLGVGLLQCISVGWMFEYETTAIVSEGHRKSLKAMSLCYWIPVVISCFYANFLFYEDKEYGLLAIVFTTSAGLMYSKHVSGMAFNSWYHEIVLCGVDKLSMSITSLSNDDQSRSWWMIGFEIYFGICIKFVLPACIVFVLCSNLEADMAAPFAD